MRELPSRVRELGMEAVALTDHGVMYGAVEFYESCRAEGVKPIFGCEMYVAPRTRHDREGKEDADLHHLLLLAEDQEGLQNLFRLVSLASLEGFYYKPRVDLELLSRHSRGLIALSSCLAGAVPKMLLRGEEKAAEEHLGYYRDIFGPEGFFLELQRHGLGEQERVNPLLVSLARRMGIGLVATNDVHYLRPEDAGPHDVLVCIQTGKKLEDQDRLRYPGGQFYLKSPQEMEALFSDLPEALFQAAEIASRCKAELELGGARLPHYELPPGFPTAGAYLRHLCYQRLPQRYPSPSPEVLERLEYELRMIEKMGYPGYFLIVADFIDEARRRGIAVGPGRGSAAGSLVAYVLGITGIDPLRYHLLFERFLNPERVSLPDMDIDFDDRRRDEVILYVRQKYGEDRVAQIITFGRLFARAAIRDAGRVMGFPLQEVDRVAKMVPPGTGMTMERALEMNSDLRRLYEENPRVRRLLQVAGRIEGLPRHASVHAAGVVIAPGSLMELVPLQKMPDGTVVTQYDMGALEKLGLLKFDFLGLRTLGVVEETARLVGERGEDLDPYSVPLDDPETYRLLQEGATSGVFQLESEGMREALRELRPTTLEDVIAAVALYRPGPMENIPAFVRAKHEGHIRYPHPLLEPILRDTYGILVYQEQIMQVASVMAGFTLAEADILRRAVGKKKKEVLDAQREAFVAGCLRQGHPRELAEELYDLIVKFANYGFNRAHAAAYGFLAYVTAYLKAHYPLEFMSALLNSVRDHTEKVAEYIAEASRLGIAVLPPDVNESGVDFTPVGGRIRFGLAAVKNVGASAVAHIVEERRARGPFRSPLDFLRRVDKQAVNRRTVESLIKAGAFDSLEPSRTRLLLGLDRLMEAVGNGRLSRAQTSFFELESLELPPVEELPLSRLLALEKEVLGLYISGHPLQGKEEIFRRAGCESISSLRRLPEGSLVRTGGAVAGMRLVRTRQGETMAFLELEDLTGRVEVVVFPRVFRSCRPYLQEDALVSVSGRISLREDSLSLVAEEVGELGDTPSREEEEEALFVRVEDGGRELLEAIRAALKSHPGPVPVFLLFPGKRRAILADRSLWVERSERIREALSRLTGPQNVYFGALPGRKELDGRADQARL